MWILHETHNTPHRVEQLVILNKVEGLLGREDGSFFFQEKYKFIRSIDPSQQKYFNWPPLRRSQEVELRCYPDLLWTARGQALVISVVAQFHSFAN